MFNVGSSGANMLTEQIIATDFLLSAKSGVKTCAAALAETASPQVRATLRKQLDSAIATHEQITNYMMKKGYYHAYNPQEQIKMDMKATDAVMELQS